MQKQLVIAAMVAMAGVLTGTARAASFDCAKAKSPVERAICSNHDLSAADTAMSTAYRGALAGLPAESVSKVRTDQLRWLQWLQTGCSVPGIAEAKEPSKEPDLAKLSACMLGPYRERTDVLKHVTARVDGVLFLMRSMYLLQPNSADDTNGNSAFAGFGQLEATWPEAQSNDPQWLAWNAGMLEEAQRASAQQVSGALAWSAQDMADAVDASVDITLPKIEAGRTHSDVSYDMMGHGAAHPNESFTKVTWLLPQKRLLRASDVFRPGTPWQKAMAEQCWAQLKSGNNAPNLYPEAGPASESVLRVVSDVHNWTLTDTGISVSWPEYSVAPRATPQDDTEVPWKVLHAFLVPGFKAEGS